MAWDTEEQPVHDQEEVFRLAWEAPGATAIELPPVDVNKVLRERYDLDQDFAFSGESLWDMEVRKASAPDKYLPTVVKPGSAEKFPGVRQGDIEEFTRVSDQRLWLDQSTYGTVIEHIRLDHRNQRAIFIGAAGFTTPDGRTLHATSGQPIFHVEHSVAGTEDEPLNLWLIVHVTEQPDPAATAFFAEMGRDPFLRVFNEVYVREVAGRDLRRRPLEF